MKILTKVNIHKSDGKIISAKKKNYKEETINVEKSHQMGSVTEWK